MPTSRARSRRSRGGRLRIALSLELGRPYVHFVEVISAVNRYAMESGRWEVVLDPFAEKRMAADPRVYDGVIGRVGRTLACLCVRLNVPVVNVWYNSPAAHLVPSVLADVEALGPMAADHLLMRGFRRFGFLYGGAKHREAKIQLASFRSRLAEHGCDCTTCGLPVSLFTRAASWQAGWDAIDAWIRTWKLPIAVFAMHDECLSILRDIARVIHRINVPHELALLGCHNERAICETQGLTISSIDLDYLKIGWEAAGLLDRLMAGQPPPKDPLLIPPKELVARQSTDVMVCDDPLVAKALRFMADHCSQILPVARVAEAVGVSLRSLQRQFKKELGRSIAQELGYFRLERAKRLVVQSKEPLGSLSRRCGYSGFQQMLRAFVTLEAMTPAEFRARKTGTATDRLLPPPALKAGTKRTHGSKTPTPQGPPAGRVANRAKRGTNRK